MHTPLILSRVARAQDESPFSTSLAPTLGLGLATATASCAHLVPIMHSRVRAEPAIHVTTRRNLHLIAAEPHASPTQHRHARQHGRHTLRATLPTYDSSEPPQSHLRASLPMYDWRHRDITDWWRDPSCQLSPPQAGRTMSRAETITSKFTKSVTVRTTGEA